MARYFAVILRFGVVCAGVIGSRIVLARIVCAGVIGSRIVCTRIIGS